jgi:hypothetical protein
LLHGLAALLLGSLPLPLLASGRLGLLLPALLGPAGLLGGFALAALLFHGLAALLLDGLSLSLLASRFRLLLLGCCGFSPLAHLLTLAFLRPARLFHRLTAFA